jgi:hypothetical protein
VFENRVLRRIFGPKRDEETGGWRKLHNEELHNLYSSPRTIIMIKSRLMGWAGHVARMGEKRNAYRIGQSVSHSVSLAAEPHPGHMTKYFLHFNSYGLVFVGRPL